MSLSTAEQSVFTWIPCLFPFRSPFLPCFPQVMSLFISSCFSGSDLCSQSGFNFLDQSRGEIGSVFREIGYGSASCYN